MKVTIEKKKKKKKRIQIEFKYLMVTAMFWVCSFNTCR